MSGILEALPTGELLCEVFYATRYALHDPEGTRALLEEVQRRGVTSEGDKLWPEAAKLLTFALDQDFSTINDPRPDWYEPYLAMVAASATLMQFVYHATLRSRLAAISVEGLRPRAVPQKWRQAGIDAHASEGVYLTEDWRVASSWVPPTGYDKSGKPLKGCIIRIPQSGLQLEPDRLARMGGCLIARTDSIAVPRAGVRFYPFTVTARWLALSEAVTMDIRHSRRSGLA